MVISIILLIIFVAAVVRLKAARSIAAWLEVVGAFLLLGVAIWIVALPSSFVASDQVQMNEASDSGLILAPNLVALQLRDISLGCGAVCFAIGYAWNAFMLHRQINRTNRMPATRAPSPSE